VSEYQGPPRYSYELSPTARRHLLGLPAAVATLCADYIEFRLVDDPWRMSSELQREPLIGSRSARPAKDWRIVFSIDERARLLRIERIGHRGTIYRP
jgi:mRNA-degrading endonuclease RelE of RelBE toxin-antitoxin system